MKCFKELTFASFLNLKPGPRSEAKPLLLQFYLFDAHIMLVLQSLANFGFFINLFSELQNSKKPTPGILVELWIVRFNSVAKLFFNPGTRTNKWHHFNGIILGGRWNKVGVHAVRFSHFS